MAIQGKLGKNAKVEIQRATPNTWVQIIGARSFTLPDSQTDEIDVTWLSSPNKEYLPGQTDLGEISLNCLYNPGSPTDVLINALRESGEEVSIRFTLPIGGANNYVETATGFAKGYKREIGGANEAMTSEVTFRITGKVVTP